MRWSTEGYPNATSGQCSHIGTSGVPSRSMAEKVHDSTTASSPARCGCLHCTFDHNGRNRRRFSGRSEEHTSELQSLMRISYAVFCLKKKKPVTRIDD